MPKGRNLTPIRLTADDMPAVKRLAADVILLGIFDAARGKEGAESFLKGAKHREGLNFWCEVVNLDPELIIRKADEAVTRMKNKRRFR